MYLFTRRARLVGGKVVEAMGWATEIAQRVGEVSGMQVRVFTTAFGPEVGAVRWSTFAEDVSSLQDNMDVLLTDKAYLDLVEKGTSYIMPGSVDDGLAFVVHGEPDLSREINYVVAVRTTMVGGGLSRGIPLGVEIAQHSEKIIGLPSLFVVDVTGNYGGVGWLTAFESAAEMGRAQMALNGDAGFVEFLDSNVNGVYASNPGATRQEIHRRIA